MGLYSTCRENKQIEYNPGNLAWLVLWSLACFQSIILAAMLFVSLLCCPSICCSGNYLCLSTLLSTLKSASAFVYLSASLYVSASAPLCPLFNNYSPAVCCCSRDGVRVGWSVRELCTSHLSKAVHECRRVVLKSWQQWEDVKSRNRE